MNSAAIFNVQNNDIFNRFSMVIMTDRTVIKHTILATASHGNKNTLMHKNIFKYFTA